MNDEPFTAVFPVEILRLVGANLEIDAAHFNNQGRCGAGRRNRDRADRGRPPVFSIGVVPRHLLRALWHRVASWWKNEHMQKGFTRKPQEDERAMQSKNYITPGGLQRLK